MKIVIVGAGVVGLHLAKTLSWEEHEVSIIDQNQDLVDRASGSLDVLAIRGSGTSIETLIEAGIETADLLVAVTSIDEVNIVASMLARQLGAKTRIARVRNQEYSSPNVPVKLANLGIDQIIHPELEAAREVVKMIRYPHAVDIVECAGGRMTLIGFRIDPGSPVANKPLKDLMPQFPEFSMRVVAISREGQTIIPSGKDDIEPGDLVYVITQSQDVRKVFEMAGKKDDISRDVMLFGGGLVGRLVAEGLEGDKRFNVKLIETDPVKSRLAAQYLKNTMVVRSSEELDIDMMALEGIDEMGVFAALSDDDENNIVTSLFAKHLKVKRTITLIAKPEYMPITRAIGLDAAVNALLLTSDAILKHLIGTRVLAVSTLRGINAEIIEFLVADRAKMTGKKLRDLKFPKGSIAGAIEHSGEVSVAVGESVIQPGQRIVIFCVQEAIPKLEKMFS